MAFVTYLKAHLFRSLKWVSVTLIVVASLWFLHWYDGHIEAKYSELDAVYDSVEVRMELSNIQGSSTQGLGILGFHLIPFFEDEFAYKGEVRKGFRSYLRDPHYEMNLVYNIVLLSGEGDSEESLGGESARNKPVRIDASQAEVLCGVRNIRRMYAFRGVGSGQIHYFAGYGDELFDFRDALGFEDAHGFGNPVGSADSKFLCIIPKAYESGLRFDDAKNAYIELVVAYNKTSDRALSLTFRVAGIHTADNKQIYCPFPLAAAISEELSMLRSAGGVKDGSSPIEAYLAGSRNFSVSHLDAVSAALVDNRKISELKEILELYFPQVNPAASSAVEPKMLGNTSIAYAIHDEQLNQALDIFRKNIQTLNMLRPLFVALAYVIVFSATFFYFGTKKVEHAICRSLGMPKRTILLSSFVEVLILGIWPIFFFVGISLFAVMGLFSTSALSALLSTSLNIGKNAQFILRASE